MENIYLENIEKLPMKLKKCDERNIYEFDSLEELREFDSVYRDHSGSRIMEYIAETLGCRESEIHSINPAKRADGSVSGIQFLAPGGATSTITKQEISPDMQCREAAGS